MCSRIHYKIVRVTSLNKYLCYGTMELNNKGKAVPLMGLEWPRGCQEVKVPRFHENGTGWW